MFKGQEKIIKRLNSDTLDYLAKAVRLPLAPQDQKKRLIDKILSLIEMLFFVRSFETLTDSVKADAELTWCLLIVVKLSSLVSDVAPMSSKAITILNMAHVSFSDKNFSSINIPGADLTGAIFYRADVTRAGFSNAILRGALLNFMICHKTNFDGAIFGEKFYFSHMGPKCFVFSMDGVYLASGNEAGEVRIWNVRNNTLFYCFALCTTEIESLDFNNDGSLLAISSPQSDTVFIMCLVSQCLIKVILDVYVSVVCFSPKNKNQISFSDRKKFNIFDIEENKYLLTSISPLQEGGNIRDIAYHPNGHQVVFVRCLSVELWDCLGFEKIHEFSVFTWRESFFDVRFLAENSQIITNNCTEIILFSENLASILKKFPIDIFARRGFDVFSGHNFICAAEDNRVFLWKIEDAELKFLYSWDDNQVSSVRFSPDGLLASSSSDNLIKMRDIEKIANAPQTSKEAGAINSLTMSKTGDICISAGDNGKANVWLSHLLDKYIEWQCDGPVKKISWQESENIIAMLVDRASILKEDNKVELLKLDINFGIQRKFLFLKENAVYDISLSFDGAYLVAIAWYKLNYGDASEEYKNIIYVWSTRSRGIIHEVQTKLLGKLRLEFHPFDNVLALSSFASIFLFSVDNTSFNPILEVELVEIKMTHFRYAFCGDYFVTGSDDGSVHLWMMRDLKNNCFFWCEDSPVSSLAFSSEEKLLASGHESGLIFLWEIEQRKLSFVLYGHVFPVTALIFNSLHNRLVSGGKDSSILIWEKIPGSFHWSLMWRSHHYFDCKNVFFDSQTMLTKAMIDVFSQYSCKNDMHYVDQQKISTVKFVEKLIDNLCFFLHEEYYQAFSNFFCRSRLLDEAKKSIERGLIENDDALIHHARALQISAYLLNINAEKFLSSKLHNDACEAVISEDDNKAERLFKTSLMIYESTTTCAEYANFLYQKSDVDQAAFYAKRSLDQEEDGGLIYDERESAAALDDVLQQAKNEDGNIVISAKVMALWTLSKCLSNNDEESLCLRQYWLYLCVSFVNDIEEKKTNISWYLLAHMSTRLFDKNFAAYCFYCISFLSEKISGIILSLNQEIPENFISLNVTERRALVVNSFCDIKLRAIDQTKPMPYSKFFLFFNGAEKRSVAAIRETSLSKIRK